MKPNFKFRKINKLDYDSESEIMPAYAHDFGNYVARYGMGNFQIQVVMKLDGRIDFDKLSRAVRLSVDAEPVLGCRFVEDDPPYWKRREDIDEIEFCTMEETTNAEDAVERFLESPLDMDHDPMVKVKLVRSQEYDTIVIKLNHTCTDGAGTKEYIHLLAHIYSCIDCKHGAYTPKPSVRSREDHERILNTLGIEKLKLENSVAESPWTVWPFPWKPGGDKNVTPFVICRLPGQLDILSKFAKERGATINDLILAALYRAMFKLSRPPYGIPMDIGLTVDLRRYLPDKKAQAIRNLSGGTILRLPRIHGESFEGTLSRVANLMKCKKNANPGYQCASGAECAEELLTFHQFLAFSKFVSKTNQVLSQFSAFCSPGLSNLGLLSRSLIKFGEHEVIDAYVIPPVISPPGLMIVAQSYNGILTLAAGYYKGSIDRKVLEKLLNKVKSELMEGCKIE